MDTSVAGSLACEFRDVGIGRACGLECNIARVGMLSWATVVEWVGAGGWAGEGYWVEKGGAEAMWAEPRERIGWAFILFSLFYLFSFVFSFLIQIKICFTSLNGCTPKTIII